MTDKEKIKLWAKGRLFELINGVDEKDAESVLTDFLTFIDSMQEEPVAPKVLEDMLNAKTAAESLGISQEEHDRIVDELIYGKEPEMVDIDDLPKEEPVSKDFEEFEVEYLEREKDEIICVYDRHAGLVDGAKWQKEQFEKNRLVACDKQTEEEAEIERDFVMGIIENEHRQPTFDDAIKYGMRLQKEQMMTKSIEAVVSQVPCSNEIILYNPSSVDKYYLPQEMNKLGLNKGDKVKLVIIKED